MNLKTDCSRVMLIGHSTAAAADEIGLYSTQGEITVVRMSLTLPPVI